jgi:hypothetical protein
MRHLLISLTLFAFCAVVRATPIQWPASSGGNDHYYDFISDPNVTWTNADAAAQAQTFDGVHGYLATLTSAGENTFVVANFSAEWGPFQDGWLGGYQDTTAPDYSEPAGGWRWVTGEPWSYTNWFTGGPVEPDNSGGNQNYLRSNVNGQWDDFQNDPSNPSVQYISGYFVEYTVPEPASAAVLLFPAACFLGRRGKRLENRV